MSELNVVTTDILRLWCDVPYLHSDTKLNTQFLCHFSSCSCFTLSLCAKKSMQMCGGVGPLILNLSTPPASLCLKKASVACWIWKCVGPISGLDTLVKSKTVVAVVENWIVTSSMCGVVIRLSGQAGPFCCCGWQVWSEIQDELSSHVRYNAQLHGCET